MQNLLKRLRQSTDYLMSFEMAKLTPSEVAYCQGSVRLFTQEVTRYAIYAGILFHGISLALEPFVADGIVKPYLMAWHIVQLVLLPLALLLPQSGRWLDRSRFWTIMIFLNCAYYAMVVGINCRSIGMIGIKPCAVLLAQNIVFILFSPYHGRFPRYLALFQGLTTFAALWGLPFFPQAMMIFSMSLAFAVVFQKTVIIWTLRSAHMEFRCRVMLAPAHVVARAVGHEQDIAERFKPKRRRCVCVAVQWRNYDTLAYTMPPSRLAALLGDYYALADRLINECVKGGAYYCDLMVDEMFIFVFEPEGLQRAETQSVADAVMFARRLLRERTGAAKSCAIAQIDIGISHGEVLIGVLGPDGHKKTTGVGEIPGRAARLKAAGALLRQIHGDADRLMCDAPVYRLLAGQTGFKTLLLDGDRKIKDLDDEILYFWEHRTQAFAPTATEKAS